MVGDPGHRLIQGACLSVWKCPLVSQIGDTLENSRPTGTRTKLAIAICVVAAVAVMAVPWEPENLIALLSTAIIGGFGLGTVLLAGLAIWWRKRRRRQLINVGTRRFGESAHSWASKPPLGSALQPCDAGCH